MASQSGLGSCTFWGLTPSLNLLDFLDENTLIEADDDKKAINILLFGQSDCRHILKTMEEHLNFRTTKQIKINIYLVESNLEVYARQLLFLHLASQPTEKIGLYEKTRQFVELFANTHIRPKTQTSLIRLSRTLVKMITDDDYLAEKLPFVTLSELKFIERDGMVEICKYWSDYCDAKKENIANKWDHRLRCHLGTRYDSRLRIFDWDYHMRLADTEGAEVISSAEYKRWRNTGMAIEEFENEYSQPNVTLISGASNTSNMKSLRFMGEIITGPFIAYGIECDDKNVFEKSNGKFKYSSADITIYNLEKIFHTITEANVKPYQKEKAGVKNVKRDGRGDVSQEEELTPLARSFSVIFLPIGSTKFLNMKKHFLKKFQLIYFSSTMAQNLTPQIAQVFAPEAIVIVEGVRHVLELRKEHTKEYDTKVEKLAQAVNLFKHEDDRGDYHRDYLTYTMRPAGLISETDSLSLSQPQLQPQPTSPKDTDSLETTQNNEENEEDKIHVIKKPAVMAATGADSDDEHNQVELPTSAIGTDLGLGVKIETGEAKRADSDTDSASDPEVMELLKLQKKMGKERDCEV